ncbi:PLP-dependent aminotransferase family protein [Nesterenkonia sp. CF4.4]|uniref:aminotransferase-like domain-containing protein n=1 Tax=Nesterenkonia sp. CF4.4 TaxID=3373079 RepID=UPI003EE7E9B1
MYNDSTERVSAGLQNWIRSAAPGAQLPSNRELVAQNGVSPVTVQKAMRTLSTLGLVESRPGVGTFVRASGTRSPADYGWQTAALGAPHHRVPALSATQRTVTTEMISLHSGYPARELLPGRLVRTALARAARTESAMTRSPTQGLPELQAWFATQIAAVTPPGVAPPAARDAIILNGSQSGLSSVFRSVVGAGQTLLVESPTYWGAILAARQTGVELVPVPTGPSGPDPEDLDRAFAETGARAFYAQPNFANPTGVQWSVERGDEVLQVVRQHGAFLIEDDWAHDLGIDAESRALVAHDMDGRVIYLRSLTKSVSPSLRVAAVIARGPARERILADRAAEAMYVSGILQTAALDVVTQPGWKTHLRGFRTQLRTRRDHLIGSLHKHLPEAHIGRPPVGGLNLWVRMPDGVDVEQLARDAYGRGVVIAPGTEWFPAEPSGSYIRLNYSGTDPERFNEAISILKSVLNAAR